MKLVGSKGAVRTPEFHKRKLIKRWLVAVAVLLLVLVLVIGPILLLRNKHLRIVKIEIVGNEVTKSETLETLVANNLSGYYLRFIPKDSVFFYPKNKIKNEVLSATPRLLSVDVSRTSLTALKVQVVERQPHALYCQGKCYFLDATGYIFAEAPSFSGDVYMTYTTDEVIEVPIRTQLFQPDEFKGIESFLQRMQTLNIKPEVLKHMGDEYDLTEKRGPVIRWKEGQDLNTIFVNLESFINNSGLSLGAINAMMYIDLRFDNKVFYK